MANPNSKILLVAVPQRIQLLFQSHRLSYMVSSAANGTEALGLIETENIQLCILNDELLDLEKVIRHVRRTPWGANLPILVITSTKTHEELFKLGADAFFGTTESDAQFLDKIELLLGLSDGSQIGDFSKKVDTDNSFHHALQYASQLVEGMHKNDNSIELRKLPPEKTLQSLAAEVEGELRGHLVGVTVNEIPEGLEAVEPQAYIGHQLSVGERMESNRQVSSLDSEVASITFHESLGSPLTSPTAENNGGKGELHSKMRRTAPLGSALVGSLVESDSVKTDSGNTMSQPFVTINSQSTDGGTLTDFPGSGFASSAIGSPASTSEGHQNTSMNDSGDEAVVLTPENSPPLNTRSSSPFQRGAQRRSVLPERLATTPSEPERNNREGAPVATSFEIGPQSKDGEPLEGMLQNVPLWQVFRLVMKKKASGRLWVQSRDIERQVFFENGSPVVVYSNAKEDRLVELLYREGRISEKQYKNAAMTIAASGRRAGVVMVEKGIIATRELFPLVRYHYESILFDMFGWTDGAWKLMIEPFTLKERILLDVRAHDILLDAFRTYIPTAQVQQLVGAASMVSVIEGEDFEHMINLSTSERELLEWCNGKRSVRWLAQRFSIDIIELQAFLAGMVALGRVMVDGVVAADNMKLASSTIDTVIDSAMVSGDDDNALDANHEATRINEKYMQVEEATYFDIAEVSPDASSFEIRKSLQRLKSLYAPKRYVGLQISDLQEKLSVIGSILDEAGDVLFDEQRRERYRQAIM